MATLYLTEYGSISFVGAGSPFQKFDVPPLAAVVAFNSVSLSSSSSVSTQINAKTHYIEACSDTNCWLAFGTTNTVSVSHSTGVYLPAGVPRIYSVNPNGYIAGSL